MTVLPGVALFLVSLASLATAELASRHARRDVHDGIRLVCALYAALAAAVLWQSIQPDIPHAFLAGAVGLLVSSLAPVLLAFTLARASGARPSAVLASSILLVATICGIVAAALAAPLLSFAPLFAAVCAIWVVAARRWRKRRVQPLFAIVSGLALFAGACGYMAGSEMGMQALLLFSDAGLLGIALSVSQPRSGRFHHAKAPGGLRAWLVARESFRGRIGMNQHLTEDLRNESRTQPRPVP